MMIARLVRIALLLAVTLLVSSQPARGSGGFGTSIAAFSTGACNDTGSREWVELTRTYGLLCGRPKHKSIELITVYAPGCDEGHLILRDLKGPDGRTILLFSAPANLMKKTVRATIYVKGHSKDLALLEHVEEDWKRVTPMKVLNKIFCWLSRWMDLAYAAFRNRIRRFPPPLLTSHTIRLPARFWAVASRVACCH